MVTDPLGDPGLTSLSNNLHTLEDTSDVKVNMVATSTPRELNVSICGPYKSFHVEYSVIHGLYMFASGVGISPLLSIYLDL